jgi:hypothetical protein
VPPSRLASCSLLADNAFLEGKGRLIRRLDELLLSGGTFPTDEAKLASGVLEGASYSVTARGSDVAPGTAVTDQPVTVTSTCRDGDGTEVRVVVQGRAMTRSAFEIPFCACGDVVASGPLTARFPAVGSSDPNDTARLLLAANGEVRLAAADIQGGVIAGGDLSGSGMPAGGSYAGGENRMAGTARVLPTPRPCRCDDTAMARELPTPAVPVAPAPAPRRAGRAPVVTVPPSESRCDRWLVEGGLEIPAGSSCELAGGRYPLTRLRLLDGAKVSVHEPIRLELSGDGPFEIGAGAVFDVANPGDLVIASRTAADLRLGAGAVRAWVFAPEARVVLDDGARFEGALSVGHLALGKDVGLVADPRAQTEALYVADFQEDAWRLEPTPASTATSPSP